MPKVVRTSRFAVSTLIPVWSICRDGFVERIIGKRGLFRHAARNANVAKELRSIVSRSIDPQSDYVTANTLDVGENAMFYEFSGFIKRSLWISSSRACSDNSQGREDAQLKIISRFLTHVEEGGNPPRTAWFESFFAAKRERSQAIVEVCFSLRLTSD